MDELTSIKIGERLAELRRARGRTQKALGDECGIPWRTLQNWEAAKREVSATALISFAKKFGWSPQWILTGEGSQSLIGFEQAIEDAVVMVDGKLSDMDARLPIRKFGRLVAIVAKRKLSGNEMTADEMEANIAMGEEYEIPEDRA